jgi:hypothetical protein
MVSANLYYRCSFQQLQLTGASPALLSLSLTKRAWLYVPIHRLLIEKVDITLKKLHHEYCSTKLTCTFATSLANDSTVQRERAVAATVRCDGHHQLRLLLHLCHFEPLRLGNEEAEAACEGVSFLPVAVERFR